MPSNKLDRRTDGVSGQTHVLDHAERAFAAFTDAVGEGPCRVQGCPAFHIRGLTNARFCLKHSLAIPGPFVRAWSDAKDHVELERVWQRIADDFVFEGKAVLP